MTFISTGEANASMNKPCPKCGGMTYRANVNDMNIPAFIPVTFVCVGCNRPVGSIKYKPRGKVKLKHETQAQSDRQEEA